MAQYLAPLLTAGIDQLVLGCTHYPFLRPLIEEMAGTGVSVIDPAPAVARQTGRVLAQHDWLAAECSAVRRTLQATKQRRTQPAHRFYTTGDPSAFNTRSATCLA